MDWKIWGAFAFGTVIGWFLYFINRYRKGDVSIGDITTVLGVIGGAAVLALFDSKTELFGAYSVGLAAGFFGYFLTLIFLVGHSEAFNSDWFLDGRRPNPPAGWGYGADTRSTVTPMAVNPGGGGGGGFHGANPGAAQNFYIGTAPATAPAAAAPAPVLHMPTPAPMVAPSPNAQRVIESCQDVWPGQHNACNFFAIDVAAKLNVTLSGTADTIWSQIQQAGWTRVTDGAAARTQALAGRLVVAAMRSGDFAPPRTEGHVAIVVSGQMNPGGWAPAGYWGSTDPVIAARGGEGSPISLCWRKSDKDRIVYAARDI